MSSQTNKIAYVNGLRGVAILMVVWHHLYGQHFVSSGESDLISLRGSFQLLAVSGWLGVNVFFVLSGFVLFLPFAEGKRPFCTKRFLIRRAWRILPLYYLNVVVCLGLMAFFEPAARVLKHGVVYAAAALPSPALFFPPYNPPLWSLGIEIWFSVFFPLFVVLMGRFKFMWVLLAVVLLSLAIHLTGMLVSREAGSYLNPISDTLPGRFSDFAVGMFAAWLWKGGALSPFTERLLALAGALFSLLALAGSAAWFRGDIPAWTQTIWNLLLAAGVASMIVGLRDGSRKSLAVKGLEFWPLQVIGLMCFSIYIWHWQLIELFSVAWGSGAWVRNPTAAFVYILLLLLLAGVSFRFVEFPWERDVRSLFGLQPSKQAPPRPRK